MNILAIDTTTSTASVSVKSNNNLILNKVENNITHSEKLLPLVDETLKKTNINISDISMLACINGPGSFTGIRIGLATIKALAQVNNIEIFSINSLELIAYCTFIQKELSKPSYIASLISTNNDRLYYCIYKLEKIQDKLSITSITDIKNDNISDVTEYIKDYIKNSNSSIYISGNAVDKIKDNFKNFNCNFYDFYPTTNDCINLINSIYNIDNYIFNAYTLEATYARLSQAERMKNEKL